MNSKDQASGSFLTKTGKVKRLTNKEAAILFSEIGDGDYQGVIDVEIEFKTEKQGLALAKKFQNLAANPAVKINVKFINLTPCKNLKSTVKN